MTLFLMSTTKFTVKKYKFKLNTCETIIVKFNLVCIVLWDISKSHYKRTMYKNDALHFLIEANWNNLNFYGFIDP